MTKRRVVAAVGDMFFAAKIRTTAEHLSIEVDFARSTDAAIESAKKETPALIIIDLHLAGGDFVELAEQLKSDDELRFVPILGFFSHVEIELKRRAEQAGIDHVLPRSAFTKQLPEILQKAISRRSINH